MQLYRLKSSLLCSSTCLIIGLSLVCSSCNEKPVFKKKHYTTKRVVRNYKKGDSVLATATTRTPTATENKTTTVHKPIVVNKPTVANKIKPPTTKPQQKAKIKLIKKRQNKYYIIAASYTEEFKAIELAVEYMQLGFPVEIISANNKFRVTINSERNKQKAIHLRDSLRVKLKRKDFWLLRY